MTYGAEMPVIHYEGMTIVAESPHSFGRDDRTDSDSAETEHEASHV